MNKADVVASQQYSTLDTSNGGDTSSIIVRQRQSLALTVNIGSMLAPNSCHTFAHIAQERVSLGLQASLEKVLRMNAQ